ncbi:hypothetical protein [Komagataeibacter swingsii]|nr:hypothetical protein [Komagataeibacter swingsii]
MTGSHYYVRLLWFSAAALPENLSLIHVICMAADWIMIESMIQTRQVQ